MRVEVEGKRANVVYDSMADMVESIEKNREVVEFRNRQMRGDDGDFYGANSMESEVSFYRPSSEGVRRHPTGARSVGLRPVSL